MCPITSPLLNTDRLEKFANFLRSEANRIIDALFVERLIEAIKKHPGADISCIERWLNYSFSLPAKYDDYNCTDAYNCSFKISILDNLK